MPERSMKDLECPRSSIVVGRNYPERRGTYWLRRSCLRTQFAHRSAISDRAAWFDVDIECDRFELRRSNFYSMGTGFEIGLLEGAVEVVDDSDKISVHIHFGVALRQVDPQTAVRTA